MQAHHGSRTAHWLASEGHLPSDSLRNGMHCDDGLILSASDGPCSEALEDGWDGNRSLTLHLDATTEESHSWGTQRHLLAGSAALGPGFCSSAARTGNADRNYGRTFAGELEDDLEGRTRTASRRLGWRSAEEFRAKVRPDHQQTRNPTCSGRKGSALAVLCYSRRAKRPGTGNSEDRWASKSRRGAHLHRRSCVQWHVTGGPAALGVTGHSAGAC